MVSTALVEQKEWKIGERAVEWRVKLRDQYSQFNADGSG